MKGVDAAKCSHIQHRADMRKCSHGEAYASAVFHDKSLLFGLQRSGTSNALGWDSESCVLGRCLDDVS